MDLDESNLPSGDALIESAGNAEMDTAIHEVVRADHRWSGWPGCWCLDCGIEDAREYCIAAHPEAYGGPATPDNPMGMQEHCVNPPCPEPGSNRCNPYVHGKKEG